MNTSKQLNPFPQQPSEPGSGCLVTSIVLLSLIGLPVTLIAIYNIIIGAIDVGLVEALIFFGITPIMLSGWFYYLINRKHKKFKNDFDQWFEKCILIYANYKKEQFTAPEAAVYLGVNVDKVKEYLDKMVLKNIADVAVSQSGNLLYNIKGLHEEKKEIMDFIDIEVTNDNKNTGKI